MAKPAFLVALVGAGLGCWISHDIDRGHPDGRMSRNSSGPQVLILLISLIVSLAMNMGEIALPHVSEDVRIATQVLINGRLSGRFWGLVIGARDWLLRLFSLRSAWRL